ncbi:MAG: decaprenyl-phosphate phosphoribosyltransferase [Sandaracinaceae bacterium]
MLAGLIRTMRPHQWVKNVFVLAPVVFAQELFVTQKVVGAVAAFACFSLLASAVYVLNDIVDVEADRAHPVKKNRPLASGVVSLSAARVTGVVLAAVALTGAWFVHPYCLAVLVAYVVNNIAYSFGMKRVAYLDVMSIVLGFELRVLAGSYAADVPPSVYLLAVTFLLAFFLGFGKRFHELEQQEHSGSASSRKVLERYNKKVVRVLLWVTGAATVCTYMAYTLDPHTREQFGTPWLPVTGVFTLFAILRFMRLVRGQPGSDSPTEEMLKDIPFIANFGLWAITVVAIIYLG